ncbi:16S rRNA (uracil(1498)-N(3))-methyltransferase [Pedobacter sp. MC2016-14]|uniref:16S rRNA (uracil(1498)-N(3))-methyltransferase n=1 Tax=Pedobacter sp. MC2016-14 TaxID=2897327 RepID=UPI001E4CB3CE|nr:16S rRNA (uracil(1498)-N(3))-methyltransferase [Pedobacter sp. MC2016-14]MCD0487527.1 16S rRNA (uracil(1498)-N(3))-methyltransferase [Pedobacter sp. MC2016-14]
MHVFYTPDIQSDTYTLNEEESRHCAKVLRLGKGDKVTLIDGRGGLYDAEIVGETKRNITLSILNTTLNYQKRNHHLHIAIAPTKNIDRYEWFLEKVTEIGVEEITPIICERSERKVVKEDRLNKVITSAVKQSLQAYHPILNEAVSFKDFVQSASAAEKMIAHCVAGEPRQFIDQIAQPAKQYLILIGPEGDFSPAEIELALQNGFKPLTLGTTRLRTETAGLAACFEVNYLNR